jgi:hypothetical protein
MRLGVGAGCVSFDGCSCRARMRSSKYGACSAAMKPSHLSHEAGPFTRDSDLLCELIRPRQLPPRGVKRALRIWHSMDLHLSIPAYPFGCRIVLCDVDVWRVVIVYGVDAAQKQRSDPGNWPRQSHR